MFLLDKKLTWCLLKLIDIVLCFKGSVSDDLESQEIKATLEDIRRLFVRLKKEWDCPFDAIAVKESDLFYLESFYAEKNDFKEMKSAIRCPYDYSKATDSTRILPRVPHEPNSRRKKGIYFFKKIILALI